MRFRGRRMIFRRSLPSGIWLFLVPHLELEDGHFVGDAGDALLLRRRRAGWRSRVASSSPTRMTPWPAQRPMHDVHVPVGGDGPRHGPVTTHVLSMAVCRAGCPSMAAYCADWAWPNKIIPVSRPSRCQWMQQRGQPVSSPTMISTAMMPSPWPKTMGIALGLARCTSPATIRNLLQPSGIGHLLSGIHVRAGSPDPDLLDMRAMHRSIRFRRPDRSSPSLEQPGRPYLLVVYACRRSLL